MDWNPKRKDREIEIKTMRWRESSRESEPILILYFPGFSI